MYRVLFAISLVAMMACGSGESTTGATTGSAEMPAVSAEAPKQPAAAQQPIKAPEAAQAQAAAPAPGDAANAAQSQSCIDLVAAADFEAALPVCLQAASIDPENAEVQAALAKAKAEAAAKAATGGAAGAAADALRGINN